MKKKMWSAPRSHIRRSPAERNAQELRRRRWIASRLSFSPLAASTCFDESEASTDVDNRQVVESKLRVKQLAVKTVPSSISGRKDYGTPTTQDSQGRNLFTRHSDGNSIYVHCYVLVPGC